MNTNQEPKIIESFGLRQVQIQCALCATTGKISYIYLDEHSYSIHRNRFACPQCVFSEFLKEKDSNNKYISEYLPPRQQFLYDLPANEVALDKDLLNKPYEKMNSLELFQEQMKQERHDAELIKFDERNLAVAKQFALGVPDTEEQRKKYERIFTNKGPWRREITGQYEKNNAECYEEQRAQTQYGYGYNF